MKILAIETTGHFAGVALGAEKIKNDTDYSHLQEIVPMCMEILSKAGQSGPELDAIAVSRGPGSFTGIRIGMASAKGLAQIWDKPIVCVPTLDSFAYRKGIKETDLVVPIFDARRSQVYAGAFMNKKPLIPGAAYDIEKFKEMLEALIRENNISESDVHYFGDGCSLIDKAAEGAQEADQVLALAEEMFKNGQTESCYSAEPEYMRLAEAERKLKGLE